MTESKESFPVMSALCGMLIIFVISTIDSVVDYWAYGRTLTCCAIALLAIGAILSNIARIERKINVIRRWARKAKGMAVASFDEMIRQMYIGMRKRQARRQVRLNYQ